VGLGRLLCPGDLVRLELGAEWQGGLTVQRESFFREGRPAKSWFFLTFNINFVKKWFGAGMGDSYV
jgi:hypothetical protein